MTHLPLNPTLFGRLEHLLGDVVITAAGVPCARARWLVDPISGRQRLDIGHPRGEQYLVRCPVCRDHKFRLYVHHLYGQKIQGREVRHLAHCFNENCFAKQGVSTQLWNMLHRPTQRPLSEARIFPGDPKAIAAAAGPPPLPGRRTRIDRLPSYHPAVSYLLGRGYDPKVLWRDWHVTVCIDGAKPDYVNGRIIIPVYDLLDGKLQPVCWQARHAGEDYRQRGVPKYHTCGQKSRYLYGFDRAKKYPFGVLVEGAIDVWGAGPPAFASLGDGLSDLQFRRIQAVYGEPGKALLLLYDPEAYEEDGVKRRVQKFRNAFGKRVAVIRLPDGTDPGSLHRGVTRGIAVRQAREQGVEVDWPEGG